MVKYQSTLIISLVRSPVFSLLLSIAACLASSASTAAQWGHWKPADATQENIWSSTYEATPDLAPEAWLISKMAKTPNEEIVLLNIEGRLVKRLPAELMRHIFEVKEKIENAAELEVDLYVMPGDTPNASAGTRNDRNTVLINLAMIDLVGDNIHIWAALLGHEIAHLKLGHGNKRAKRNMPLAAVKAVANVLNPLGGAAAGYLLDGVGQKFGRDAERQSDYIGVVWAIEAEYSAYGAAELHEKLALHSAKHPLPFLSSHPSSAERIKTLTDLADRLSL
ncbi:MAG: Zn-dependent protease with chaperone function [Candidatus Azotimanducaceae bacterium]|jgi:Zn-dependent protease with chaperone function